MADGLGRNVAKSLLFSAFFLKQAGCISEAQSWEKMIKAVQAEGKDSAWSKLVLLPKLSVFIVQSLPACSFET